MSFGKTEERSVFISTNLSRSLKTSSVMIFSGYITFSHQLWICICKHFSMVAEIGGYSGLLIGFSVMDLAVVLKSFMDLLKSMKDFQ